MSEKSLPKTLWDSTLNQLIDKLSLTEVSGENGGEYLTLISQVPMVQGPVGNVRLFKGDSVHHVVTCSIVVPPIGLDSHMLFAFGKSDSAVPHFTLDSVKAGDHNAFHLDLVPRMDLGANLAYMDEVYTPLTEVCETTRDLDGMDKAHISPRQYAIMSPWMLVQRATDEAFKKMDGPVNAYMDHWLNIVNGGVSDASLDGISGEELIKRDARNKAIIFDPDVDPVWARIEGLIGAEAVEHIRGLLKSTSA